MQRRIDNTNWFFALAALSAIVAVWPQGGAHAGQPRAARFRYAFSSVGIVPGEAIRVSIANTSQAPPDLCRVYIYDPSGHRIGESGDLHLAAAQTISVDFSRSRLNAPGEPRTDRLQVRAVVEIDSKAGPADRVAGLPAVEVLAATTGRSLRYLPEPRQEVL